ncbi:MAG: amidohydrolase [Pseudomonadota bacterium]
MQGVLFRDAAIIPNGVSSNVLKNFQHLNMITIVGKPLQKFYQTMMCTFTPNGISRHRRRYLSLCYYVRGACKLPNKHKSAAFFKIISTLLFLKLILGCTNTNNLQSEITCPSSDLLLYNTAIYTADDTNWRAEALAIKDDRIVFVGSNEQAKNWKCGAKNTQDLSNAYVYPGFTDGHQHLEGVGRRTRTLSLFGIPTLAETVDKIDAFAANVPENNWVLGRGWIEREWTDEKRFLTAADVDPFTQNKPLFMPRADGVSALVNSKALALAGITKDTSDPQGGKFERDSQGNPTGYVLATAMDVFRDIIPEDTDQDIKENLLRGMQVNASMGWTQTHDAGMKWREVTLLRQLHQENQMAHRVYIAIPIKEANFLVENGVERSEDGFFDLRGIKVFIDGTLGSRGAALIEPYADAEHRGFMNRTTKDELMPVLDDALIHGIQIMTHVIGDRALHETLNWYQESWDKSSKQEWKTTDIRWRLEHAQIIPIDDQKRMVNMNVMPSMQPSHAIGDLNFAPYRLGLERLAYSYPWQSLIDRGLKIIAGSDAPVELGDPRIEFYAAITRNRLDGTSDEGWHPELAVTREDALRMLTLWPAIGAFQENDRGTIEVGKQADLSIFDTDFMSAAPEDILKANTVMTVVGGKIRYQAD